MSLFAWKRSRKRRTRSEARRAREFAELQVEALESRQVFDVSPVEQFLLDSTNLFSISTHPADLNAPVVRLYSDSFAGGSYALINAVSPNFQLDDNDPDAGHGFSSLRATRTNTSSNAFFEYAVGADGPRNIPDFGFARQVRFMSKGDADGQQLQVNVFQVGGGVLASQVITLTSGWSSFVIDLPAGTVPSQVRAVQFVLGNPGLNAGNNTFRIDELRLGTDGFDPLRIVQSYRPAGWASGGNDLSIYPNRSFTYDNALTIKALWTSDDPTARTTAANIAAALLATERPDGSYFNERAAGRVLAGDGTPRNPYSQLRTLGDNAWFGLALADLYVATGDATYLAAARRISDWAEVELKDTGALGGYRGGFDPFGNAFPWRSTEHNIDLFALNRSLDRILSSINDVAATTYAQRAAHAGDFVIEMFDDVGGKFWTGTTATDAINQSSVPLDAQVWAIMAMASDSRYSAAVDWNRPLAWVEANLLTTDGSFSGVRYSNQSPNKVWFEGTGQLALLYALRGNASAYATTLGQVDFARLNHPNADGLGIVAASSDGLIDSQLGALYDARLHAGASAWFDLAQSQTNPFTLTIAPPKVTGVYVTGSSWQSAYTDHLADSGLGHTGLEELGFRLSVGADQLQSLPWRNVDKLSIRFNEAVLIVQSDLTVVASNGAAVPAVTGFTWDSTNFVATWTFASALPTDKYLLQLGSSVVDAGSGAALDGEWTTGTSTASGDGTAGGHFHFRFNALTGDLNGMGSVTFGEIGRQFLNLGLTTASVGFNYRQDIDGTGSITPDDVDQARLRLGTALSSYDEPTSPSGGAEGLAGPEVSATDLTFERALAAWPVAGEHAATSPIDQAFAAAVSLRLPRADGPTSSPDSSAQPEFRCEVDQPSRDGRWSAESQRVAVEPWFVDSSVDDTLSAELRGRFSRFGVLRRDRRG